MDRDSIELAQAGLRLFSREMSPEYERVRSLLLGRLAAHGATVEQLAQQEVNDRQNVELLSKFTTLLPSAVLKDCTWSFLTDDPYKVKIIQSHVVWREEKSGAEKTMHDDTKDKERGYISKKYSLRPYFLLGKSYLAESHRQTKEEVWLLACVGADDQAEGSVVRQRYGDLFSFKPNRKTAKRLSQLEAVARSEYPSPEETRDLFDLEKHLLIINGYSLHSTVVRSKIYGHARRERISDVEFGQLEVNSHLERIATALGIKFELNQLFSEHVTKNEPATR